MEIIEEFNNCVDRVNALRAQVAKTAPKSGPNCSKEIEATRHLLETFDSNLLEITRNGLEIANNARKITKRLSETQSTTLTIGRESAEKLVEITETVKEMLQQDSERPERNQGGLEAAREFARTAETGLVALAIANANSEKLAVYRQNFGQWMATKNGEIESPENSDKVASGEDTLTFIQLSGECNSNDSTPHMIFSENVTTSSPIPQLD